MEWETRILNKIHFSQQTRENSLLLQTEKKKEKKMQSKVEPFVHECDYRTGGGGILYESLSIGVPKEIFANEKRVALSPMAVKALVGKVTFHSNGSPPLSVGSLA